MTSLHSCNSLILKGAEKALCEKSLYEFVKRGWSKVDPTTYVDDWHVKVLCDELQKLSEGEFFRLIINMPPRCLKSTIVCVFFPVWEWIKTPTQKILTGSYSGTLAVRDTVKSRYLIQSPWFQELWWHRFSMTPDQNQKTCYRNIQKGERICFSVGGTITGEGGDLIIIDDPINAMDADSQVIRESVNRWYSETVTTRLNDPKTGKIILVMQRLNQNDLSGYLLSQSKEWRHIVLPMRYEGEKRTYDKRKKVGQILTKRHNEKSLRILENGLGSYGTASQLQQRPVPREGGIIKLKDIQYYKVLPTVKQWAWSWDTAIKKEQMNDFSVGTLWAKCDNGYYIVDMKRAKMEYPELRNSVRVCFDSHKASEVLVEDKASGQQIIQDFRRIGRMPIIAMMPGKNMPKSKIERVHIISPLFEAAKVFLPEDKPWVKDIVDELTNFPNAKHDDIVDSVSQYLCRRLNSDKDIWYSFINR